MTKILNFKEKYPDMYEFLLFNIMSNVATIVNFVVLWIGMSFLFTQWNAIPFKWFIFDYSVANG